MFTFRGVVGEKVPDRTVILERLAPAPDAVVDGLLSRFTETPRGSTQCVKRPVSHYVGLHGPRAQMTTETETRFLTHLFALCLKADDYATDTELIAADLRMSSTRYSLRILHTW